MTTSSSICRSYHNGTFTLNFDKIDSSLNGEVEQRMIATFFIVYPQIVSRFNVDASRSVQFIVDPNFDKCPAETSGSTVKLSGPWFRDHPADTDVVTHEVMHIVQAYPHYNPVWLVEGIADYVRAKYGTNNKAADWSMGNLSPDQNYTDSYRVTARFLVWLENCIRSSIVEELNSSLRRGNYDEKIWKTLTGQTLDQLWTQYAQNPQLNDSPSDARIQSGGVYKLINLHRGKVLDVHQSGTTNGTNVQICSDNSTTAQQWRIEQMTADSYKLINIIGNMVLDVDHSGTSDGTNVQLWQDNGTNAQRWYLQTTQDENIYKIANVISGKVLNVNDTEAGNSANVQIWTDNDSSSQKWRFVRLS